MVRCSERPVTEQPQVRSPGNVQKRIQVAVKGGGRAGRGHGPSAGSRRNGLRPSSRAVGFGASYLVSPHPTILTCKMGQRRLLAGGGDAGRASVQGGIVRSPRGRPAAGRGTATWNQLCSLRGSPAQYGLCIRSQGLLTQTGEGRKGFWKARWLGLGSTWRVSLRAEEPRRVSRGCSVRGGGRGERGACWPAPNV